MPERIQRRRVKGWRMPEGAVYVGRPTLWGNPWIAGKPAVLHLGGMPWQLACSLTPEQAARQYYGLMRGWWIDHMPLPPATYPAHKAKYIADLKRHRNAVLERARELRGRDLACWCPLDHPCHADVLLRIANE
jgi:hypothetical protein